jgi:hypothetical protein
MVRKMQNDSVYNETSTVDNGLKGMGYSQAGGTRRRREVLKRNVITKMGTD